MPAVLIEFGYISNKADELKLKDPVFLKKMAELVAAGVTRYKSEYERTEGFSHK
jgi:N-acetylmuramoyl-L-alanine amidase